MGPSQDHSGAGKNQAGDRQETGLRRRGRRPRRRACLLKGCERRFRPVHPLTRYCSQPCRDQARRWRGWKARHRYRQSEGGKQKRRAQSRRYRMRCQRVRGAKRGSGKAREGHRNKNYFASPAIGLVAMWNSSAADAPPCSDFVLAPVGEPWSGFESENDVGESEVAMDSSQRYRPPIEMVLRYCLSSGGVNKFGMPQQKRGRGNGAEPEVGSRSVLSSSRLGVVVG
jgi:hypothetical protein